MHIACVLVWSKLLSLKTKYNFCLDIVINNCETKQKQSVILLKGFKRIKSARNISREKTQVENNENRQDEQIYVI
jgi:replicative DNA helicase